MGDGESGGNMEKRKVLICEDEPHIFESILYVVNKAGYLSSLVEEGDRVLEEACLKRPDLIILDVGLPGMNGFDVCKQLRDEETLSHVHIIILTAFGQASDEVRAYEVGANQFLTKPFSPGILGRMIKSVLD